MWNFSNQGSICAPCSGSMQSHPLDSQGSPKVYVFFKKALTSSIRGAENPLFSLCNFLCKSKIKNNQPLSYSSVGPKV